MDLIKDVLFLKVPILKELKKAIEKADTKTKEPSQIILNRFTYGLLCIEMGKEAVARIKGIPLTFCYGDQAEIGYVIQTRDKPLKFDLDVDKLWRPSPSDYYIHTSNDTDATVTFRYNDNTTTGSTW